MDLFDKSLLYEGTDLTDENINDVIDSIQGLMENKYGKNLHHIEIEFVEMDNMIVGDRYKVHVYNKDGLLIIHDIFVNDTRDGFDIRII